MVADAEAREAIRGQSLTSRAETLWTRARLILDEAEARPTVQLAAIRELRAVVELLGRLTGAFTADVERPTMITLTLDDGRPVSPHRPYLEPVFDGNDGA